MGKETARIAIKYVNGRTILRGTGRTDAIIGSMVKGLARILVDSKKPEITPGVMADKVRGWVLEDMLEYLKEKADGNQ